MRDEEQGTMGRMRKRRDEGQGNMGKRRKRRDEGREEGGGMRNKGQGARGGRGGTRRDMITDNRGLETIGKCKSADPRHWGSRRVRLQMGSKSFSSLVSARRCVWGARVERKGSKKHPDDTKAPGSPKGDGQISGPWLPQGGWTNKWGWSLVAALSRAGASRRSLAAPREGGRGPHGSPGGAPGPIRKCSWWILAACAPRSQQSPTEPIGAQRGGKATQNPKRRKKIGCTSLDPPSRATRPSLCKAWAPRAHCTQDPRQNRKGLEAPRRRTFGTPAGGETDLRRK